MHKKSIKKLKLSKDTLRMLAGAELEHVAGAGTGRICAEIFCCKSGSCPHTTLCFTHTCKSC